MMILIAVISLGVIGIIGALLLYWASRNLKSMKTHVSGRYSQCYREPIAEDADIRVVPDLPELVLKQIHWKECFVR